MSNPSAPRAKTLAPGIYSPTVTFFKPTKAQELDIENHVKHMEFLARSGINGVVLQGSTGEAVALDREERKQVCTRLCSFRCLSPPPARNPRLTATIVAHQDCQRSFRPMR